MKVNWDDYSQYMGKYKMFQTTNQLQKYHRTTTTRYISLHLAFRAKPHDPKQCHSGNGHPPHQANILLGGWVYFQVVQVIH